MAAQQINKNLFTGVEGFEEFDQAIKDIESKKRGPYKTKQFKPIVLSVYQQMDALYSKLANYLPLPLFSNEEAVFLFGGIKAWYTVYTQQEYEYENQIFTGEIFKIKHAEIIGTENLSIEKRIELHQEFLELLHNGVQLEEAMKIMQPKIKLAQPINKELDRRLV